MKHNLHLSTYIQYISLVYISSNEISSFKLLSSVKILRLSLTDIIECTIKHILIKTTKNFIFNYVQFRVKLLIKLNSCKVKSALSRSRVKTRGATHLRNNSINTNYRELAGQRRQVAVSAGASRVG